MFRTQPGQSSRPPLYVPAASRLNRLLPAVWVSLSLLVLALAGGLLVALLSSSATRPVKAQSAFVFDTYTEHERQDVAATAERLSERLRSDGSSSSLVPEGRFWLYTEIATQGQTELVLEIRHLRVSDGEFNMLVDQNRPSIPLEWQHTKGGVAIKLPAEATGQYRIIGKAAPRYSTVLKLFAWTPEDFARSIEGFNRMGGALAGACTVLALTMGLLGLRNRDFVAVLFGLTVLLTLRIAAFNSGWDMQWLGIEVPSSLTMTVLRATLPLYAITQTALLIGLFRRELGHLRLLKITVGFCGAFGLLFLASPFLAHDVFLRAWWVLSAPGAIWLLYVLVRVVGRTEDRAAQLYALALAVTMAGALAEIAYMLGYWDTRVSTSLLGALFGSALNAAAIAERLYTDRARAVESQRREINALREKEDLFQSSPTPLFEFDSAGQLRHGNRAFLDFMDEVTGPTPTQPDPERTCWNKVFGAAIPFESLGRDGFLESVRLCTLESSHRSDTGRYVDLRWSRDQDEIHGSVQDVTERELARQAMERLVNHDQLTGVLNVHGLLEAVETARGSEFLGRYSLALIDIARFESINELFGHEAGDTVLKSFAGRIAGQCRSGELVARAGADTFVLVFPGVAIESATTRVRSIAESVTFTPVPVGGKAVAINVCIGLVEPAPTVSLEQAIGASLRTTQRAKRKRSGAVTLAVETEESLGEYLSEKRLLGRIADRLPTENFFQVMQPIINIRDPHGRFSAEALIRMRSDTGEIIPPGRFIAATERNGMMPEIDRWTLKTACEWLREHRSQLAALEYLTINVSGVSLNDIQFHADTRAILADYPTEARKLCFEITESIAVSDIEATNRFTNQLRSMGARVALDDFGAGYTSFGYLRTLPAEIVKIDGEIIKSVSTDAASTSILRAIRDIAADLGMRCVAEFVTDFDTLRALRELDIDFGQGYALCRPVDPMRLLGANGGIDLVSDHEVLRYLTVNAGRSFTARELRMTT